MTCLTGFIGIDTATTPNAPSGLYIVDLQGIKQFNLQKIAEKDADQADFKAVFEDCERRAVLRLRSAFTAELNACYRIADLNTVECLMCEHRELLKVALWYLVGAETMSERLGSDRLNRFTTIDRRKAAELEQLFTQRYETELRTAVKGINPEESACTESTHVQPNDFVVTVPTRP